MAKTNNGTALRDSLLSLSFAAPIDMHMQKSIGWSSAKTKDEQKKKGWRGVLSICGCEGVNGEKKREGRL